MNELTQHAITVFLGFFAIMNPIANTTVFIGLSGQLAERQQKAIAIKALMVSFFIILAFALLGKTIFHMFGITLPALRITGGILVFLIGYNMLHGEHSEMHKTSEESDTDIAISPLAVPILAGPGTIATAMSFSASNAWQDIAITVSAFALLCLITFVFFIFGQKLEALLGKSGINIITRLMGLILAVIGCQMLIEGIYGAIDAYH
ncbi:MULTISPECIES: MarC family protein [unclassified Agarivorans]|uniref:MarC family protein n=1 Tax=unclassified Agarivorans TaxID=2636026 RepID=UPI003D7EDD75